MFRAGVPTLLQRRYHTSRVICDVLDPGGYPPLSDPTELRHVLHNTLPHQPPPDYPSGKEPAGGFYTVETRGTITMNSVDTVCTMKWSLEAFCTWTRKESGCRRRWLVFYFSDAQAPFRRACSSSWQRLRCLLICTQRGW